MLNKKPVVLLILDGWGFRQDPDHNAIAQARKPQWDQWWATYPHILLSASGHSVGLPDEQMGNSEVGHMHIGAGRIIYQDLSRINLAIEDRSFFNRPALVNTINTLKENGGSLHLAGLLSPGGVHSHEQHLFATLKLCHQMEFHRVLIHCFLDGRDTPPQSALASIEKLNNLLKQFPIGRIASVCGRYYAMDRDKRWERVAPAAKLIYLGEALYHANTAKQAIETNYNNKVYDEFIPPTQIGEPAPLKDGDAFFFYNFRADRARQLCQCLLNPHEHDISNKRITLSAFLTMTRYSTEIPSLVVFPPQQPQNTLGELVAKENMQQLRLAETEKYAHVTFFFNGGTEAIFQGEDRILIPSPKVATYDLQPEMSASLITETLVDAITGNDYDLIVCNYANADMVGHTGNIEATIQAIETLDNCFIQLDHAINQTNGCLLITADHGNAEQMYDLATRQAHTAHTSEKVPLLYIGKGARFNCDGGSLIDIAPTILSLLDIEPPTEMTGNILLEATHDA
ncbi:2,3-bisphosphoglycerate-independent phosphoglycerate mutase [Legionella sp. W05-934-2]|uniref:2,3-bisphosphoglycerate-independent phosphoglycerate mutase n=1 Tax=Legionella sp. W05-934-2 TaxID=1198649 RepID=UPI003462DB96